MWKIIKFASIGFCCSLGMFNLAAMEDAQHMQHVNYKRIAEAIEFIRLNFRRQPELDEVAERVHVSPTHFQKIFTQWAGVSPKKFLQFITVEHAKGILRDSGGKLVDATYESGLSGTGRLHDLFMNIEGMTPGEFRNGGESLTINYSFDQSPFGDILVASTSKGICHLSFVLGERTRSMDALRLNFPKATYAERSDEIQHRALSIFSEDWTSLPNVKLHLRGTEFQLKVWQALLRIPSGSLATYSSVAHLVGVPKASRAVGNAVGLNPVAFLIPCHRVIQSTGLFGGYMWGATRKAAIIGWESAKMYNSKAEARVDN